MLPLADRSEFGFPEPEHLEGIRVPVGIFHMPARQRDRQEFCPSRNRGKTQVVHVVAVVQVGKKVSATKNGQPGIFSRFGGWHLFLTTSHMHAEGRTEPHTKKETAVSPAFAKDTAVQIPPRGVEQPADSGRETQNPPAPGTESGTAAADRLIELLAILPSLPPYSIAVLAALARRLAAGQAERSPDAPTS